MNSRLVIPSRHVEATSTRKGGAAHGRKFYLEVRS